VVAGLVVVVMAVAGWAVVEMVVVVMVVAG
jgi:hypothetical protein